MKTKEAVTRRIRELCRERDITPNALSHIAGVSQATIKSILNDESKNPGVVTIQRICEGFHITLREFFDTVEFDRLEKETGRERKKAKIKAQRQKATVQK